MYAEPKRTETMVRKLVVQDGWTTYSDGCSGERCRAGLALMLEINGESMTGWMGSGMIRFLFLKCHSGCNVEIGL